MKKCLVEGCENKSRARGLCVTHYNRLWKTGRTERTKAVNKGLCIDCGERPQRTKNRCDKCYQKWKCEYDNTYRQRKVEKSNRYRVRKLKAKTEKYTILDVYNKTNGICSLCGNPIDLELRTPRAMVFSIDHVVPLSKGGSDLLDNLQPAHFGCNSKKNNKLQEK